MKISDGLDESLLHVFLTECNEHLDVIENLLLDMENIIKQSHVPSLSIYDTIFRAIHTLKGSAGIYEFYTLQHFAHLIETVLDKLRKEQMPLSLEIIEILFKSHDILKQILLSIKSKSSDKDFNILEIKSIILKVLPDISEIPEIKTSPIDKYPSIKNLILSMPVDLQNVLQEYEINRIIDIAKKKQNIYQLKVFLNKDWLKNYFIGKEQGGIKIKPPNKNFIKDFEKHGEMITLTPMIDLLPTLENFNSKNFDLPLAILFSSSMSLEDLAIKLNIPQKQIYFILPKRETENTLGVKQNTPVNALIVSSCNQFFAIPLNSVIEIYRAGKQEFYSVNQIPVVNIRDSVVPVFLLDKIFYNLTNENTDVSSRIYIVIIKSSTNILNLEHSQGLIGLKVDKLLGQEEISISPPSHPIVQVKGIMGSTILKNNNIALVINVEQIPI